MQTSAPTTYVTLTVNGRDVISLESPELCEAAAKHALERTAGIERAQRAQFAGLRERLAPLLQRSCNQP
jgi:hypothetical protein